MNHETLPLAGKRALITGSSNGIGEAIARAFAAAGALCIIHGRDREKAERVAKDVGGESVLGDLAERGSPVRIVAELTARGGLDILVNNAGFEEHSTVADLTAADYGRVLEVNLVAPAALMSLCLPLLRRGSDPSIINITSIHETVPVSGNGAYASAKAGLASLTRTAAVELGPEGIRVNTIAPGAIKTEMNRELIEAVGAEKFEQWIPMGRVGVPEEVADVAVFLASRAARYITGSSMVVDGGYSNHLVRYDEP